MYKIQTEFSFEAAHKLKLDYTSPCQSLHGHSYLCRITVASQSLDKNGMICDFKILKQIIKNRIEDRLDHHYLNDIFVEHNSTAEFMSKWICEQINNELDVRNIEARCVLVELNETAKNKAIWEEDLCFQPV